MEGIESVRSVFKVITATTNAARPIQFNQRKARPEIGMGEMGLKATIISRNPVARRGWPERIACPGFWVPITCEPFSMCSIFANN